MKSRLFSFTAGVAAALLLVALPVTALASDGSLTLTIHPIKVLVNGEVFQPKDAAGNDTYTCYAKPVTIGNDVWFGANVVVCPGVTIGDGCVIGAGSVVTKDIPANCFAAGNPCRVIREITEADSMNNKPEILGDYQVG